MIKSNNKKRTKQTVIEKNMSKSKKLEKKNIKKEMTQSRKQELTRNMKQRLNVNKNNYQTTKKSSAKGRRGGGERWSVRAVGATRYGDIGGGGLALGINHSLAAGLASPPSKHRPLSPAGPGWRAADGWGRLAGLLLFVIAFFLLLLISWCSLLSSCCCCCCYSSASSPSLLFFFMHLFSLLLL